MANSPASDDPRLIGIDHNGGDFTRHLSTLELALRWNMSPRSLERWRQEGRGPRYIKLPGKVVYRLVDVEAFEAERTGDDGPLAGGQPR